MSIKVAKQNNHIKHNFSTECSKESGARAKINKRKEKNRKEQTHTPVKPSLSLLVELISDE